MATEQAAGELVEVCVLLAGLVLVFQVGVSPGRVVEWAFLDLELGLLRVLASGAESLLGLEVRQQRALGYKCLRCTWARRRKWRSFSSPRPDTC